MNVDPFLVDIPLPGMTFEGGARLNRPVARVWFAGSGADRNTLDRAGVPLVPHGETESVVRRRATDIDTIHGVDVPRLETQPTIVVVHALTGDARCGGTGGWWDPVIGPGRALDTDRFRVVCVNNLGSCYGSSGPGDEGFPTRVDDNQGAPYTGRGAFTSDARLPATLTTMDQARFILLALDALGVDRVELVIGGSVGGMITLCLAALAPDRFASLCPVAACVAASPWIIGWNHIGRQAIVNDPEFPASARGLELARQIAHMSYRAEPGLDERQGRRTVAPDGRWSAGNPYRVATYLEYQGAKLVGRFTPLAYVAQLDAMDHHDVQRPPPAPDSAESWTPAATWTGVARITAPVFAISIDTDQLYLPAQTATLVDALHEAGNADVRHEQIESLHGHDAFLIEWDQLDRIIRSVVR